MSEIKLSLRPLADAIWETHETTGCAFLVAALPADLDQEITNQASNFAGAVDAHAYAQLVAPKIIRDWRGLGDAGVAVPCNPENLKVFVQHHALSVMPWIIRRARSLDRYRTQEVDAAKNA